MAEKLTPQQQMAVSDRGGRLLVSAAAGSGKTKVLVDRLLSYICDPADPANIDDFLMITYTKAAASELRGKIAAKLSERIAEDPGNRHLQQQLQRLYLTKISTVHAFCSEILKEYAYRLDIPADFRMAEESESVQLQLTVMEQLLEQAYEELCTSSDLQIFMDTQGLGRNDRMVPEIILKVYASAKCHLDPDKWLDSCICELDEVTDAAQTPWGQYLINDLLSFVQMQIDALSECMKQAAVTEGMEKPCALLSDTVDQLKNLMNCKSWDDIHLVGSVDFGRLTFPKSCSDTLLADQIRAVRETCKKGLQKKLKTFTDPSDQVLRDLAVTGAAAKGLVDFVRRFSDSYDRLKRSCRVLDFADLEHKMLDLVLGKKRSGVTAVAKEIGQRFREIMVDEYQDTNEVQDAIFSALTAERGNLFMVGDVKQSIYQFRLADPGIFIDKYNSFIPAEQALPGQPRKVVLSSNFRSAGEVVSAVNEVFSKCMSPQVGGLYYGEEEMLREGIPHAPQNEPEVELYGIEVGEDTYAEEAAFTAERICRLLDGTHTVRSGDTFRPITPEDIVILLRSPGSVGNEFVYALESRGIRCAIAGGSSDLLQAEEVSVLHALLQIIENPLQDIPLVAVLCSRVFGFTADALASIRAGNKRRTFYDALKAAPTPQIEEFLAILDDLRREARMRDVTQLIEYVFAKTRMDSVYAAMPDGTVRTENLQAFCQLAAACEATGRKDLGQFLQYLSTLAEKGIAVSTDQKPAGAVTIMSIHKSKGLEFPVVFLCGLSRGFNQESAYDQVLCDKELGLGLSCIDPVQRVRYPTLAKRAISAKILADGISEELRVLYVAMTRPKDRLIMTYAEKNLSKQLTELAMRMDRSPDLLMTCEVDCPGDWILLTAMSGTDAGAFFAISSKPECTQVRSCPWKISVVSQPIREAEEPEQEFQTQACIPDGAVERIRTSLKFVYPHQDATQAPSKQTATQLKGRLKDQEVSENTQEHTVFRRSWRRPSFAKGSATGTQYGNAMHAIMQYVRFDVCIDQSSVAKEIERLYHEGYITEEQFSLANIPQIAAFFRSDIGKVIQKGDTVLREFKFSILDNGENYRESMKDEQVLLQGVVDCALVEDDGITLIDFKTDRVTFETLADAAERYRMQVEAYATALERIYEKPVKSALLYFFHLSEFVKII